MKTWLSTLVKTTIVSLIILGCAEETEFTIVKIGSPLPENFNLCFSDEFANCQLDEYGNYLTQKTITYNTCNETSVVRVKALGNGINEYTRLQFYLRGVKFYGNDLDDGVCSREDIFCYCPKADDNLDQEMTIQVVFGERRSNELDLKIRKREEIIEHYEFAAEVTLISDYKCNPLQSLQPHLNIFDFNLSIWNKLFNNLDPDLNNFMPVLFTEGETKTFGGENIQFECSPDLFHFENRDSIGWCAAVEDWLCGHSDQDYDYLMTYETESYQNYGRLRLSFRPVTHFGAKNVHLVTFYFPNDSNRILNYEINKSNGSLFLPYESGSVILDSYNIEPDGRYSYKHKMPEGVKLFQNNEAEAIFTIMGIEE